MHGGCTPGGLVAVGLRLLDLPRPRGRRPLRRVIISEGDQALDGGPPAFGLVCRWRVVEEQLRPCERFRWSGGERGRAARGAEFAQTPNSVRRSKIPPPRRLRFACARTVVRAVPRTSGLPLAQQADATSCDMALLGCRLLGRTRLVHRDRGSVVRPVLGSGGAASVLASDHPSDGVSPAHRWLRQRRKRRRRACDLRSLLLRGHGAVVDEADELGEVDEECARANTGSGSHNLDAPSLARQRCRGKLSSTSTYGAGAPSFVR